MNTIINFASHTPSTSSTIIQVDQFIYARDGEFPGKIGRKKEVGNPFS